MAQIKRKGKVCDLVMLQSYALFLQRISESVMMMMMMMMIIIIMCFVGAASFFLNPKTLVEFRLNFVLLFAVVQSV